MVVCDVMWCCFIVPNGIPPCLLFVHRSLHRNLHTNTQLASGSPLFAPHAVSVSGSQKQRDRERVINCTYGHMYEFVRIRIYEKWPLVYLHRVFSIICMVDMYIRVMLQSMLWHISSSCVCLCMFNCGNGNSRATTSTTTPTRYFWYSYINVVPTQPPHRQTICGLKAEKRARPNRTPITVPIGECWTCIMFINPYINAYFDRFLFIMNSRAYCSRPTDIEAFRIVYRLVYRMMSSERRKSQRTWPSSFTDLWFWGPSIRNCVCHWALCIRRRSGTPNIVCMCPYEYRLAHWQNKLHATRTVTRKCVILANITNE